MTSEAHLGRHQLLARLTSQVGSEEKARALLIARGQMNHDGSLTAAGQKRNNMTAAERAKDRAGKASPKHSAADYIYNVKTNRATLRKPR